MNRYTASLTCLLLLTLAAWPAHTATATPDDPPADDAPSLATVLDDDGRLVPGAQGSFVAEGYRMAYGADGAPRFVAAAAVAGAWSDAFATIPVGFENTVFAVVVDGTDVYIGGAFANAGGEAGADGIVRWDTNTGTWHALGSGLDNSVHAIAIDGSNVYVGGEFTTATDANSTETVNNIARWDGTDWHALGSGVGGGGGFALINAIAVSGTDLYVGGEFTSATDANSTETVNYVARWDGTDWHALGSGVNGNVYAIAVSGTDLYVGGRFTTATDANSTETVNRIARWDGTDWHTLGSGVSGGRIVSVESIAVNGSDIYIGGYFTTATDANSTETVNRIARWDGTDWHALGSGLNDEAFHIQIIGGEVYVGGGFSTATDANSTETVNRIARWDGTDWHALGAGVDSRVRSFAAVGSDLYVGGHFVTATDANSTETVHLFARWDGTDWHALSKPASTSKGLDGTVNAVAIDGNDVYVGGYFDAAGGVSGADNIARWNNASGTWHALGSGVSSDVFAIAVGGGSVYVGGEFGSATDANSTEAVNQIARWDGTDWHALGSGVSGDVYAVVVDRSDVYVGGEFTSATDANSTETVNNIARWDGTDWHALGSGVDSRVHAIVPGGSDVYVGGTFVTATDANSMETVKFVARWDGTDWHALGSGVNYYVVAIALHGSDVYIGGYFTTATDANSTETVNYVARWDGTDWHALGSGVDQAVTTMHVEGSTLIIGGQFTMATDANSTETVNRIASWDGTDWSDLESGLDHTVYSVAYGAGGHLFVGGRFTGTADNQTGSLHFGRFTPTSPLPVELTAFGGHVDGASVLLQWQTLTETNNAGFEVERRPAGAESWRTVGFVEGHGTTTEAQRYAYRDEALPEVTSRVRYRLRQVDYDGTFEYSPEVEVALPDVVHLALGELYPAPVHHTAHVTYAIPERYLPSAKLEVFDVLGRRVSTLRASGEARGVATLDVSGLAAGAYVLRLSAGGAVQAQRFVVAR